MAGGWISVSSHPVDPCRSASLSSSSGLGLFNREEHRNGANFETLFSIRDAAHRRAAAPNCRVTQGVGLSIAQRKTEHRRHRRRRPALRRSARVRTRKHRRAGGCRLEARRAGLQTLGEGREVQRLPPDARQRAQEHRRRRDRHARSHACDAGAGLHATGQARLRRETADAHAVGSAPADAGRGEIQSRHADGQPGLLARRHARGLRNHLVGRDRRSERSSRLDRSRQLAAGDDEDSAADAVPDTLDWDLWLGGAAARPFTAGDEEYKDFIAARNARSPRGTGGDGGAGGRRCRW